jgi:hypothetical protein
MKIRVQGGERRSVDFLSVPEVPAPGNVTSVP